MSIDNRKLKVCPIITDTSVTDKGEIRIRWTNVAGAEKYAVKRAERPDTEPVLIAWTGSGECEYIDRTAKKDITYWYRIFAVKTFKSKRSSKKVSPVAARVVSDIPAPSEVKAVCKGEKIKLQWKATEGIGSFVVYRRNEYFNQLLPLCRVDEPRYTDKDVVSGQIYHYSIQGLAGAAHGNFSSEVTCVSLDSGELLQVKPRLFRRVDLKARIVAGADGYIFERSEDGESFEQIGKTDSDVSFRLTDTAKKAFRHYYYRVRAYKNVGGKSFISKPSRAVRIKTK